MKKIRITIAALAVSAALLSAFRPCNICQFQQQYYQAGSAYLEAGIMGLDYDCFNDVGVCTYWRPFPVTLPNYYETCQRGQYILVPPK